MLAVDSLRAGNLGESLNQLQEQVRKDPSNSKYRVFLFQVLAVTGQWDRALNQLNVVGDMDASTLAMVQTYREALQCEGLRQEVFAGNRSPVIFGHPEKWVALLFEALRLAAQGEFARSQSLREEAFELAPVSTGSIDGQAFEWIADADTRMGPMLEVIINGRYYWAPFHRIGAIRFDKPEDLRDVVWMPAYFTWANGGESAGLVPTRYPGSESSDDDSIRMAQKTEWLEMAPDLYTGVGQRMLATDQGEHALMDLRQIKFDITDQPSSDEPAVNASDSTASPTDG